MEELESSINKVTESITISIPLREHLTDEAKEELERWISWSMDQELPFIYSHKVCGIKDDVIKVEIPRCYFTQFLKALISNVDSGNEIVNDYISWLEPSGNCWKVCSVEVK